MKVGDLIRPKPGLNYPQYAGKTGVLVEKRYSGGGWAGWIVMIGGRLHPYVISEEDMEMIYESR